MSMMSVPRGLRTPDAIQLATARTAGAAAFLANDARQAVVRAPRVLVVDSLPPEGLEPPRRST